MFVVTLIIIEKDFYDNVDVNIKYQAIVKNLESAKNKAILFCQEMIQECLGSSAIISDYQKDFIRNQLSNFEYVTLSTGEWEIFVKKVSYE